MNKRSLLYKIYKVDVLKQMKKEFLVNYNNKKRKIILDENYIQYKNLFNVFSLNARINKNKY